MATSSFGSVTSQMGTKHYPLNKSPFLIPPYGIEIDGTLYRYAIDVMTLLNNETSTPDSHDFGVACGMGHHVRPNVMAPNGLVPDPNPVCVNNNVPVMPVLRCDSKSCTPIYDGPVPAYHGFVPKIFTLGNNWSALVHTRKVSWDLNMQSENNGMYATNLLYNLSDSSVINIKNATSVFSGQTYYCSEESECLRTDELLELR